MIALVGPISFPPPSKSACSSVVHLFVPNASNLIPAAGTRSHDAGVIPQNVGYRNHADDLPVLGDSEMSRGLLLHQPHRLNERPVSVNRHERLPHTGLYRGGVGV